MSGYLYLNGSASQGPTASRTNTTDDYEIVFDGAANDWTPSGSMLLMDVRSAVPGGGIRLILNTNGTLGFTYYSPAAEAVVFASPSLTNGTRYEIKFQRNQSAGTVELFVDGVSTETVGSLDTGDIVTATDISIGESSTGTGLFEGAVYRVAIGPTLNGAYDFDADFTNLTQAEIDAAAFTEDSTNAATVTLNGDAWAAGSLATTIAGKTPELYLDADVSAGAMWFDRSGNDHHGQFGSAGGDDTNDPLRKRFSGDKHTNLPGTASNYMSLPDTNLLDADTAHLQQSIGLWGSAYGTVGGASQSQALTPVYGDFHGVWTASSAASGIWFGNNVVPAVEGEVFTFVASIAQAQTNASAWSVNVRFYTAGGVSLGNNLVNPAITVSVDEWQEISHTATAPATAAFVAARWGADGATAGDVYYFDALCVRKDADATFVPSIRIVGDLDMRADYAMVDWNSASDEHILSTRVANDGFMWGTQSSAATSRIFLRNGNGSDDRSGTCALNTLLSANERANLRVTFTEGVGWQSYQEGIIAGAAADATAGPASPSGDVLAVGSNPTGSGNNIEGDVFWAEIRDGIDGPVVGRYDSGNAVEPYATVTDDYTDSVWTINRSASGLVSTVIDQSQLIFSTDDYVEVADHADLDFAAGEPFTLMAVSRTFLNAADGLLAGKVDGANSAYRIYANSTGSGLTRTGHIEDTSGTGNWSPDSAGNGTDVPLYTLTTSATRLTNPGSGNHDFFDDGVLTYSEADPTTGVFTNAAVFLIGGIGSAFLEGSIMAVALFREALSDAEILAVSNAMAGISSGRRNLAGPGVILQTG